MNILFLHLVTSSPLRRRLTQSILLAVAAVFLLGSPGCLLSAARAEPKSGAGPADPYPATEGPSTPVTNTLGAQPTSQATNAAPVPPSAGTSAGTPAPSPRPESRGSGHSEDEHAHHGHSQAAGQHNISNPHTVAPADQDQEGNSEEDAQATRSSRTRSHFTLLDSSPLSSADAAPGIGESTALRDGKRLGDANSMHVKVGMRITNFEKIDTKNGTFRFTGQLIAEWNPADLPPDLQAPPNELKPPAQGRTLVPGKWKYWEPSLIMVNILSQVNMGEPVYFIQSDGKIRAEVRFAAPSVATRMDFRHFPFDTQYLVLELAPGNDNLVPVRLEPIEKDVLVSKETRLAEWQVKGASSYTTMGNRVDVCIEVKRFWTHYVANIFVPMFIIVAVSYATMWVPRNNLPGACSLVGITIASLFLLKLTVSSELARTDGLTYLDAIAVFHIIAAASAATLNVVISRLWKSLPDPVDESPARLPRTAFPVAYFAGWIAISTFYFLL